MVTIPHLFLVYLGLTLLLEAPVYATLLSHRRWKERVIFWLAANLYSYPAVFYYFPYLDCSALTRELLAESWAPLCEIVVGAIILPQFRRRDALTVVVANLVSWQLGRFLLLS